MIKYLLIVLLLFSIIFPKASFAVQDVVFSENITVTLTDPAMSLIIQNTKLDEVVVNTTNVVITMSANVGPVTITSPNRYKFTVSGTTDPGTSCGVSESSLVLPTQTSAVAVTITPSTVCALVTTGSSPSPSFSPSPSTLPAPITTTGAVTATTAQGGETTLTTTEGTKAGVKIPSEAISANTAVVISPIAKTAPAVSSIVSAVPANQQFVGGIVYDYTATFAGTGSSVTSFSKDLTLTFTYTDEQLKGLNASSIVVHYYDEIKKQWLALPTTVHTGLRTITATTNHLTRFALLIGTGVADKPQEIKTVSLVDIKGGAIVDGDLIKTATSFDIHIVKLIGNKKFKRLILNPDIFNSYGHLKWENVKTVSQTVQDSYVLADLVIEVNDDGSVFNPRVYKVSSALNSDVGVKQWLNMTVQKFEASGYDWDAIYKINHKEASVNFYPEGAPLTS